MKKSLKIILVILSVILSIFLSLTILFFSLTKGVKINEEKLINYDFKINYYDENNTLFFEETNGKEIIEFNKIPKNTINAFIAIEDRRFYKHNGIDIKSLNRALFNNIKSFSFKEGASTITQQLVKNTHLSSDKTITRKLKEIRLAKKIEKKYSKDEILEKYLNTIYFGDGCYGIKKASYHYFSKNVEELSINESAILASIIKAPSIYSPTKNIEKNRTRKNIVLTKMLEEGYITQDEYNKNYNKKVELNVNNDILFDYKYLSREKVNEIIENSPYETKILNVYTYLNQDLQKELPSLLSHDKLEANKSAIIMDKENHIIAYSSTIGDVNRQIGSTIKPLAVYAPALDCGNYYLCSKITDKKININGYSPSNYNDKYYGEITFSESLEKSLNSVAVQILNSTGVEKSLEYLEKFNLEIDETDKNLSLALGSTKYGQKLSKLSSTYSVFRKGDWTEPKIVREIRNDKNIILYKNNDKNTSIFRKDTANLMKIALKNTVNNGTAKKLSFLPFELCSKTGTVGNEKGNTDAYNISFNDDYTIGVWYGNKDGKILENNVLGGTNPTIIAKEIWDKLSKYVNIKKEITIEGIQKFNIDKISYEDENVIILADDNAPDRFKQAEYFGEFYPKNKSLEFTSPKIDIEEYSVNNNVFSVRLCQTKYLCCDIFAYINNKKILLKTIETNDNNSFMYELQPNTSYTISLAPFYEKNGIKIYGEEIIVTKIKSPSDKTNGDWWTDDI